MLLPQPREGATVLVVDDDTSVLKLVCATLELEQDPTVTHYDQILQAGTVDEAITVIDALRAHIDQRTAAGSNWQPALSPNLIKALGSRVLDASGGVDQSKTTHAATELSEKVVLVTDRNIGTNSFAPNYPDLDPKGPYIDPYTISRRLAEVFGAQNIRVLGATGNWAGQTDQNVVPPDLEAIVPHKVIVKPFTGDEPTASVEAFSVELVGP